MLTSLYLVLNTEQQDQSRITSQTISSPPQRTITINHGVSPMSTTTNGTTLEEQSHTGTDMSRHSAEGTISQETGTVTSQQQTTITMDKILSLIDEGNAQDILKKSDLHYYFLKHCVINVITRHKWKDNCARNDYYKFIHPSDEGFALLVLDNNAERYRDMLNHPNKDKKLYAQPKYTTVTSTKGTKSFGKGWTDVGKKQFQSYTEMICNKRQDKTWLERRSKSIKKHVYRDRKNSKKRTFKDVDTSLDREMNKDEKNRWNEFMMESVNNMADWTNNSVAL